MLKLNKHIVLNTLLLTIVLLGASIFSTAQVTEETAKKLFDEGRFGEALPHFNELLKLYPNEHLFQYYYGVCLTETGQFGNTARKLLLQASQEKVPNNVLFYIGKNYHALNDFETALTYYARFDNYGKRKEKRSLNFQSIFDDCKNNINSFVSEEVKKLSADEKDFVINPYDDETAIETDELVDQDAVYQEASVVFKVEEDVQSKNTEKQPITYTVSSTEKLPLQHELVDSLFEFILTRNIIYRTIGQFKTDEGKMWFTDGWRKANELNKTLAMVSRLRSEYNQAPSNEIKDSIANHLLELEMNTLQLKKLTDESNMKAREAEMNYWKDAPESELLQLNAENDSINQAKLRKKKIAVFNEIKEEELFDDDDTEAISDSVSVLNPANKKIEPAVDKVIYKVQIGAFSRSLPDYIDRLYKKLSVLRRIDTYTTEKGVVVYTIGELTNLDDAVRLQNQIRVEGVSDAFVVAFKNGKRITLNEAKEITVP